MIDGIKNKFQWLFSSHYKMERFGTLLGCLSLCMVLLLVSIVHRKALLDQENLGTNVVYTTMFDMSLSGNNLSVQDIVLNESQTKCFVLLKFADMTNVVTDASQYHVFLTGSNLKQMTEELLCNPTATVYMFGVTGYMGIYLTDMAQFQSQILSLTLRCNKLAGAVVDSGTVYEDGSFSQFDQGRMYFNPGASGFKTADFLNNPNMTVFDIYNELVTATQETAARDKLTQDLEAMQAALVKIDEYEARVESSGIIAPVRPIEIRDDRLLENEGRLILDTDYVMPGGYDFDWYNGSIWTGYLDSVVPADQTAARYITNQRRLGSQNSMQTSDLRWVYLDGTEFSLTDNDIESASYEQTKSNIQALIGAWNEYFTLKKAYQTTDLDALLILELDSRDMSTNYTVNATDTITCY